MVGSRSDSTKKFASVLKEKQTLLNLLISRNCSILSFKSRITSIIIRGHFSLLASRMLQVRWLPSVSIWPDTTVRARCTGQCLSRINCFQSVLLESLSCWRFCPVGDSVLLESLSCWGFCPVRESVLLGILSCWESVLLGILSCLRVCPVWESVLLGSSSSRGACLELSPL